MIIEGQGITYEGGPLTYLGREEAGYHAGYHRFRNPACDVLMDDAFLGQVLAHPGLAPAHAEAMERAKA